MTTHHMFYRCTAYLLLAAQMLAAVAAPVSLATVPVDTANLVPPNIIFSLDDSGSMDMEVMQDTADGAFWYDTSSFYTAAGTANVKATYRYGYLFPNGMTVDGRLLPDDNPMYAVPPLPEFAVTRSARYNSLYYNPAVTYLPWNPAYIGSASTSFAAADVKKTRSHPIFSVNGTPTTIVLTALTAATTNANTTFKMVPGMVIPKNTNASKNGGKWAVLKEATTVGKNELYDVDLPYYPATYWAKVTTCPSGATCSTATPDGSILRRYEIRDDKTVFPTGRSYTDELQNFANWFQYYRKRKLMLAASMGQVLSQLTSIRGGVSTFTGATQSKPVDVTMFDFSATAPSANWQAALAPIYQNAASGGTPTRDALLHVGKQFMRTNAGAPVQFACQRNAAMVLTDGFGYATTTAVPAYDKTTYGNQAPYTKTDANTLADIALYYYTKNLRTDLTAGQVAYDQSDLSPNADRNRDIHMNTYALTLGVSGTIFGKNAAATANPFTSPPEWPTKYVSSEPTALDDLWHGTINGRGLMLSATDASTTAAKVQEAITDVLIKAGSQSAVAVSQVNLKAGDSTAYVSSYQVNGWYGDVQSYPVNPATAEINSARPGWSAQEKLDARDPNDRKIAYGTGTGSGAVPFRYASLTPAARTALNLAPASDAVDVIDWLRGVRTNEMVTYRARSHVLGDFVYAEPEVVQGATAAYLNAGYPVFAATLSSRARTLYQGGNDGMLHAFDAATGVELWAYIPSFVTARLKNLADKSYTHQFYVDGSPVSGDIKVGNDWKTILVGGLRSAVRAFTRSTLPRQLRPVKPP